MADDTYGLTALEASGAISVAFSPDETRIYVSRANGTIDVFNTAAHPLITTWTSAAAQDRAHPRSRQSPCAQAHSRN